MSSGTSAADAGETSAAGEDSLSCPPLKRTTTLTASERKDFCFVQAGGLSCFGENFDVGIPRVGEAAFTRRDVPIEFEFTTEGNRAVATGESTTVGLLTCTGTAAGIDCSNTRTGARFSMTDDAVELTAPTR